MAVTDFMYRCGGKRQVLSIVTFVARRLAESVIKIVPALRVVTIMCIARRFPR